MPKKPSSRPAAVAAPEVATVSIDAIFASKPKTKAIASGPQVPKNAIASSSKSTLTSKSKDINESASSSKTKKKKVKSIPTFIPGEDDAQSVPTSSAKTQASHNGESAQARVIQEVLDPSIAPKPIPLPPPTKTKKVVAVTAVEGQAGKAGKKRERRKDDVDEDEMFADSRGTGPRRKTEEGYLIYKEAELQIDPEAGGTPLCPFDCECCESVRLDLAIPM